MQSQVHKMAEAFCASKLGDESRMENVASDGAEDMVVVADGMVARSSTEPLAATKLEVSNGSVW